MDFSVDMQPEQSPKPEPAKQSLPPPANANANAKAKPKPKGESPPVKEKNSGDAFDIKFDFSGMDPFE
jgi:hypothetical protein